MPTATEPLSHEVRISAPPDVVFPYFTDSARIVEWMGVAALLDPRPGGAFRVDANGRDVVVGEYLAVEPPRRVVFTWGFEGTDRLVDAGSSRVEVTLEPDGDGTLLPLHHHELPPGALDAHAKAGTTTSGVSRRLAGARRLGPTPGSSLTERRAPCPRSIS